MATRGRGAGFDSPDVDPTLILDSTLVRAMPWCWAAFGVACAIASALRGAAAADARRARAGGWIDGGHRRSAAAAAGRRTASRAGVAFALALYASAFIVSSLASFGALTSVVTPAEPRHGSRSAVLAGIYEEVRAGFGREPPPPASYGAHAAAGSRCNTLLERRTAACASRGAAARGACTRLPCNGTAVVDTDALGGPLERFRKVLPAPEVLPDLPTETFWGSLSGFPVVVRGGDRASPPNPSAPRLDPHSILRVCEGRASDYAHALKVGYEMPLSQRGWAGLYYTDLTYAEYYDLNVRRNCSRSRPADPGEERRLMDMQHEYDTYLLGRQRREERDKYSDTTQAEIDVLHDMRRTIADAQLSLLETSTHCGRGYVHDSSVFEFCPDLLESVPLFKFFVESFVTYDFLGQIAMRQWPSLFVGNADSRSGLHQDSLGSSFFITVLNGRKLFRVMRVEDMEAQVHAAEDFDMMAALGELDRGKLSPDDEALNKVDEIEARWRACLAAKSCAKEGGLGGRRELPFVDAAGAPKFDVFAPSEEWAHVSSNFTMYETVLEAGDAIYVPSWALHAAVNLADETVAVAANFFPPSSWGRIEDHCFHGAPGAIKGNVCMMMRMKGALGTRTYLSARIFLARVYHRLHRLGLFFLPGLRLFRERGTVAWPRFFDFASAACACCCRFAGHWTLDDDSGRRMHIDSWRLEALRSCENPAGNHRYRISGAASLRWCLLRSLAPKLGLMCSFASVPALVALAVIYILIPADAVHRRSAARRARAGGLKRT